MVEFIMFVMTLITQKCIQGHKFTLIDSKVENGIFFLIATTLLSKLRTASNVFEIMMYFPVKQAGLKHRRNLIHIWPIGIRLWESGKGEILLASCVLAQALLEGVSWWHHPGETCLCHHDSHTHATANLLQRVESNCLAHYWLIKEFI